MLRKYLLLPNTGRCWVIVIICVYLPVFTSIYWNWRRFDNSEINFLVSYLSLSSKFSRNLGNMQKTSTHILFTSRKHTTGFLVKSFGRCCGSTVLAVKSLYSWSEVCVRLIGAAKGRPKCSWPPKFLENIVILCFERRFSKENSVIRLRSNILLPPNFWASYATGSCWQS